MACIDDVILDDDESEAALTHVPAGRDALLILAFLEDQDYGIRLSEERTALTEQTIEAKNIVAAYEPDGTPMMSNNWIMKKLLSREDVEMYDTKIREFADAFFSHVNSDKHSEEKDTSSETKKRRHSTDQDEVEEENMEPSGERSVKPKVTMEYRNSENLDVHPGTQGNLPRNRNEQEGRRGRAHGNQKELPPLHGEAQQGSKESSS